MKGCKGSPTTTGGDAPKTEANGDDDFLTSRQAASFLGRTPRGMQAMRDRGDGPAFVRFARSGPAAVMYRKSALEAFIRARTVNS